MSGTSYGAVVLHVAPESAVGGPLALVRDGDLIRLDVAERRLDLVVERCRARGASSELGAATSQGRARIPAASCRSRSAGERGLRLRLPPRPVGGRDGRRDVSLKDEGPRHRRATERSAAPLCRRLAEAGYEVRASDLTRPTWDRVEPGEPEDYWQADLTDAGSAYALARDCDVVVHTAAIPQPIHNPPHVVFGNNIAEHVQHARGRDRRRRAPVRQLLERDGAGIHLRPATLRAGVPPDRRRASRSAPGSVRDREVVRRAAVRPGGRALRHQVHVDPPELGAGRGELRAEPRPDRPRSVGADRELLLVRRRLRPLRRCRPRDRDATCPDTRCSTSPRPTRSAAIRSRRP